MNRSWLGLVLAFAALPFLAACGDDDGMTVVDAGRDAGADAAFLCAMPADCSDGLYCDGVETCAPGTAGADGRGCVAGVAPCGADELCVEEDDACRPCTTADADGDGVSTCDADCDDADPTRYPGATELCDYAGHDEDCNPSTYGVKDDDGDGITDARCCNTEPSGSSTCGLDCDDTRGGAHPGLAEVCNRRDDDCNGLVDDDGVQVMGFADLDRDLYGDAASPVVACAGTGLSVAMSDCDDSLETGGRSSPAYEEVPGDGVDNDCDGLIDEGGGLPQRWYRDVDGDGVGVGTDTLTATAAPSGYVLRDGDCDDDNSARNPSAPELCNGVDDDCNDLLDFVIGINDWEDDDGDGFVDLACGGDADDCDDGSRSTHPGAVELCDGRDNDCDGMIDESCDAPIVDGGAPDGGVSIDGGTPVDGGGVDGGGVVAPAITYIKQSNTGTPDRFGGALSLSADGTRLAVAAYQESSIATGVNGDETSDGAMFSGAVYVFLRSGTSWTQEAYIKASNTGANDFFGISVALSADGTRLAVGASREASNATGIGGLQTDNSAAGAGAVYVFSRTGTTWAQEAYVKASNTGAGDAFGTSVALTADGSRLAVGATGEASSATGVGGSQASNAALGAGAVYVFSRALTTWTQEAYVKASNTGASDTFGTSVSLSDDGTRLAVGALAEASNATGIGGSQTDNSAASSGAAYVFARSGTAWTQEAYVKASNAEASDEFGGAVALSPDGMRLAVGARNEDSNATGVGGAQGDNRVRNSGAVYVFSRAVSTWTQEAYVKASNTDATDEFGWCVALSQDGSRLAVGARHEDSSATGLGGDGTDNRARDSGAVYSFTRVGTAWAQVSYAKPVMTDADDFFGWSVALSADGTRTAVGAFGEDSMAIGVNGDQADNGSWNSGAVYVY